MEAGLARRVNLYLGNEGKETRGEGTMREEWEERGDEEDVLV